jgi:hypothetical protein
MEIHAKKIGPSGRKRLRVPGHEDKLVEIFVESFETQNRGEISSNELNFGF